MIAVADPGFGLRGVGRELCRGGGRKASKRPLGGARAGCAAPPPLDPLVDRDQNCCYLLTMTSFSINITYFALVSKT